MRAERNNAHSKENAYNTLGTLSYRFFYLYRYFTVNARYSESPTHVGGYICTAKTFFFKMRIWSSQW